MSLIESFFLGQKHIGMAITLTIVDLFDDLQPYSFVFFDVIEPVVELAAELASDYLVENLLCHQL
jgi:hypothetical protein